VAESAKRLAGGESIRGGPCLLVFFFQAEDGIRDWSVTGVQTCALPISVRPDPGPGADRDELGGTGAGRDDETAERGGGLPGRVRSEERRVGKEWRAGGGAQRVKKERSEREQSEGGGRQEGTRTDWTVRR